MQASDTLGNMNHEYEDKDCSRIGAQDSSIRQHKDKHGPRQQSQPDKQAEQQQE